LLRTVVDGVTTTQDVSRQTFASPRDCRRPVYRKAIISAETICKLSEICDLGQAVGFIFEWWFSAAAPLQQ